MLWVCSGCAGALWPTDADFDICPNGVEPVSAIRLSQTANVSMRVSEQMLVTAQLFDAKSAQMYLCIPEVSWTTDDPTVASVQGGRVSAVGEGRAVITASARGQYAAFTVVVSNAALLSLTLSRDTATLLVGQSLRFTAVGRDSSGAVVATQAISWSTSDSSLATLSGPNTILIAHRVGTVSVRAAVGARVATARVDIVPGAPLVTVLDLAAGWMHSCALVSGGGIPEGTAYCWGDGAAGALGTGAVQTRAVPTKVAGGLTFSSIATGERGTCGIATSGRAFCWGDNTAGQIGDGSAGAFSPTPREVVTTQLFRVLRLGRALTCGLTDTGRAYCWGAHATGVVRTPTAVAGGEPFVELTANGGTVCARTVAGGAFCWDSQSAWTTVAVARVSGTVAFTQLSMGPYHACGLTSDGSAFCWGTVSGQLGPGVPSRTYSAPTAVSALHGFGSVSAGGNFTCGTSSGATYCLGNTELNTGGGLDPNPWRMPNDAQHPFVRLVSGAFHGCAIDALGGGWCFGRGYERQLGAGDYAVPSGIPLQLRFDP